eukprot:CAMPEP_0197542692 /NCGR_PEP_ID=MMETSP1318-20131121/67842_1 /TAXON_ID=552666 /ORGANISM="Partenskyella glossopodia, Strain RCC365" /LENGTH=151 /DNA_ID=CAMNT_0043101977 /DNA_START=417 /DNA_END=872 /DNA_ORIENTATION=-
MRVAAAAFVVLALAAAVMGEKSQMKPVRVVHDILPIEVEAQMPHWMINNRNFDDEASMLETQAFPNFSNMMNQMGNAANGAMNNMGNMANSAMGMGGAVSPHYNTQDISQLPQTYYGHPFGPPYLSAPAVPPPYPSNLPAIPWVAPEKAAK